MDYKFGLKNDLRSNTANKNKKYSTFLKRKRLELHKTLEEVADQVCTPSYLSRIENNLVNVNDDYYDLLFRKLGISFQVIKEEKDNEIFKNILENYLQFDFSTFTQKINQALEENYYINTEYELMILFDNIAKSLYDAAEQQIKEFRTSKKVLLEEERSMLRFLELLYLYRIQRYDYAKKILLLMNDSDFSDYLFSFAVKDLACDIYFKKQDYPSFYHAYEEIKNLDNFTFYSTRMLKHQAQLIIIKETAEQLFNNTELFKILERLPINEKTQLQLEMCKKLFYKPVGDIDQLFLTMEQDGEVLALQALWMLKYKKTIDYNYFEKIFETLPKCEITSKYQKIVLVCYNISTGKSRFENYMYLKDIIRYFYGSLDETFFSTELLSMFIEVALLNGKYKDALKFILSFRK